MDQPTSICVVCGRTMPNPDRRYCSFACARKVGVSPQQLLEASLVRIAARQRAKASGSQPVNAPPPVPDVPDMSAATPAPPLEDTSAPILYDGGVTRDGAAWRDAGTRNELMTTRLLARDGDTLVLAGYGAGLRVEHDSLIVTEGRTHHPQQPITHKLYRGLHTIERIVCLDPQGSLSFAAAKWCRDEAITIVLLDRDGELLSTLTPNETADAQLRRCQYLARQRGTDVPIVRALLVGKFTSQLDTMMSGSTELTDSTRAMETLRTALAWFNLATPPPWLESVDQMRTYEARVAAVYFGVWRGWRVHWAKQDVKKVPPHWLYSGTRISPLAPGHNTGRRAVDPVNAALNYAYGILEAQCRQALSSRGFDVACGFLHMDKLGRDSLVYDLMECARGTVDGLVLRFLSHHILHYGDITRVHDGSCRLHPQLARAVVAACKVPQETIDQQALWLREALLTGKGGDASAK